MMVSFVPWVMSDRCKDLFWKFYVMSSSFLHRSLLRPRPGRGWKDLTLFPRTLCQLSASLWLPEPTCSSLSPQETEHGLWAMHAPCVEQSLPSANARVPPCVGFALILLPAETRWWCSRAWGHLPSLLEVFCFILSCQHSLLLISVNVGMFN